MIEMVTARTSEIDEIDEDLGDVEELLYKDCDCGGHHEHSHCHCDDDEEEIQFEVLCPSCKTVIDVDEEMLSHDTMTCPKCGGALEFVFDEDEFDTEIQDETQE